MGGYSPCRAAMVAGPPVRQRREFAVSSDDSRQQPLDNRRSLRLSPAVGFRIGPTAGRRTIICATDDEGPRLSPLGALILSGVLVACDGAPLRRPPGDRGAAAAGGAGRDGGQDLYGYTSMLLAATPPWAASPARFAAGQRGLIGRGRAEPRRIAGASPGAASKYWLGWHCGAVAAVGPLPRRQFRSSIRQGQVARPGRVVHRPVFGPR